jgi:hypothetical protein
MSRASEEISIMSPESGIDDVSIDTDDGTVEGFGQHDVLSRQRSS